MIFLLIAQVQDIEEQIETDFLSEIDKIQKPLYNIDDSLYKNKKFDIILRQYKNPKNEKEEFILAEAYYYQKNYKKADEIYSKIIRLSNDTLIIKFSKILNYGYFIILDYIIMSLKRIMKIVFY